MKNLDFFIKIRKISNFAKISAKNLEFSIKNIQNILVVVKICENLSHNFRKISILFETSRFW